MIYISHRGNLNGIKSDSENKKEYIDFAISSGFDVEIDFWYVDDKLFLGHDEPSYSISLDWLLDRLSKVWIHCKNVEGITFLKETGYDFNFFWHESDTLTLTSKGFIWAYPGNQPIKNSVAVLPELYNDRIDLCCGICSDFVESFKYLRSSV